MCAEGHGSSAEAFLRGRACGRSCFQKLRRLCVVFEAFSRKQIRKFSRKTFAEAVAEGGSKKDYTRYLRKGFAEGVVSVVDYIGKTKAHLNTEKTV